MTHLEVFNFIAVGQFGRILTMYRNIFFADIRLRVNIELKLAVIRVKFTAA